MSGCHPYYKCECSCHKNGRIIAKLTNPPQYCCICWNAQIEMPVCEHLVPVKFQCAKCENKKMSECELGKLSRKIDDLVNSVNEMCDHDERIHDLENIQAETRLIRIEKILNQVNDLEILIGRKPHQCPNCFGRGIKEPDLGKFIDCVSCEGKGVLWG